MTSPSILEWILIGTMALLVVLYCIRSIYKMVDSRKNPEKYKKKEEREREKLDE